MAKMVKKMQNLGLEIVAGLTTSLKDHNLCQDFHWSFYGDRRDVDVVYAFLHVLLDDQPMNYMDWTHGCHK